MEIYKNNKLVYSESKKWLNSSPLDLDTAVEKGMAEAEKVNFKVKMLQNYNDYCAKLSDCHNLSAHYSQLPNGHELSVHYAQLADHFANCANYCSQFIT